jgi:O-antigen ligase
VSFTQLVANVVSVVDENGGDRTLDTTRTWRLAWWNKIIGYTVDGPYFWTGKGFGINLADSDGFQVNSDGSLRSPHNGHLTMLARGGVPMLALWLILQAAFGIGLVRAGWRASRSHPALLPIIAVLFAYWLGALINMSFDVYLEGPQGGIPFWAVIGLGMVAMRAVRSPAPEAWETLPAPPGRQPSARVASA